MLRDYFWSLALVLALLLAYTALVLTNKRVPEPFRAAASINAVDAVDSAAAAAHAAATAASDAASAAAEAAANAASEGVSAARSLNP